MKVTVLLENTLKPCSELISKHGLSLYIETEHQKILFDSGPDASFLENAQVLGVDLTKVDIVVISHAHYDHGGGLEDFLKMNKEAQVYLSPGVQGEYFSQRGEDEYRYIGLNQEVLKTHGDRLTYIRKKTEILPGITLLPNTEHTTFKPSAILWQKEDGVFVKDSYDHELIMVIEDNKEGCLCVVTGCSHNGILNMVLTVEKEFPNRKIQTLIGGFHLMNTTTGGMREDEATVLKLAEDLSNHDIGHIYTGHCTGGIALKVLQTVLGERISGMYTGESRIF